MITAVDNNTKNTMESLAKVVEIKNSQKYFEPEYIKHCDSIGKEQENQNGTTEDKSDILVHKNDTWKGILDGTSHDGAISSRADTIREKGRDILETATDQEPASTQLQKGVTIRKDTPIENADWNEDATIASNEEYRRDDAMKSVKSP